MARRYEHDVFISFSHEDTEKIRVIQAKMVEQKLNVFWSDQLRPGVEFTSEIRNALLGSRHLVIYYTPAAHKSEWVRKEWRTFMEMCNMKNPQNRRIYVLLDGGFNPESVPESLKSFQRPKSLEHLITCLYRTTLHSTEREYAELLDQKAMDISRLESLLTQEKRKVEEARNYYLRNRFWGPISEHHEVHIFTCGRNVQSSRDIHRGPGGRTGIDMWDYRAVLDITHFFASNYPSAKVTIEDPRGKLYGRDLEEVARLADHIGALQRGLEDKDCIIIGSPDVSDFAEIGLARIHHIAPYTEERLKTKGFVLIKEKKYTKSSFYWQKQGQEQEGVAEILADGKYNYYANKLATEDGEPGKLYGILVVANNPFCSPGYPRKLIIMSGFSGVATNAISRILTDEKCLPEFFKLDNAYTNIDRDFEALVGVEYIVEKEADKQDTRRIRDYATGIKFERLVEI
jgi:hypothetical protein